MIIEGQNLLLIPSLQQFLHESDDANVALLIYNVCGNSDERRILLKKKHMQTKNYQVKSLYCFYVEF